MKLSTRTTIVRFATAIVTGWLSLFLAQFPLVIDSIYNVSIYWSLIFR